MNGIRTRHGGGTGTVTLCTSDTPWRKLTVGLSTASAAVAWITLAHAQSPVVWPPVPGAPTGVTAFANVTVIPVDTERVLAGHTVLVEGGRITALGPSDQVKVPTGATRIDGRDKYLIPGLGDMHAHGLRAHGPESKAALFKWFAMGVTTVRYMDRGWRDPQESQALMRLRAQAAAGELWSPRFYTTSTWVPREARPPRLDSVAAYLAAFKAAGYDFIKPDLYAGDKGEAYSFELFDSLATIGRRLGLPLEGHATGGFDRALTSMKSIEHLSGYPTSDTSTAALRRLAEATQRAGVWNTPTLAINCMTGRSGRVTPYCIFSRRLTKALQDAGAGLLFGTDGGVAPRRFPPVQELTAMVQAGLTPYQALITGTRNVAKFFGTEHETGTVAVGKRADLVLLPGNPLEDVKYFEANTIAGVMIGGRWLPREEIDRRLQNTP